MDPEAYRLQVKVFASAHVGVELEPFIPIFHGWIKNHVLKEILVDVANYAHVPEGPGIALIGHGSDYFIDSEKGRLGLLYSRKRMALEPGARLADAFRRALHAAALLEQEPALGGKLKFGTNELLFRMNDRLLAPSTDETFAAWKPDLERFATTLFEGAPFELERTSDPKELFAVTLKCAAPATLSMLLDRLGGPPTPQGMRIS